MLLIEDLQVELEGKIPLKHTDMELKPGETHVLFGPNGSGKTSLLMTIVYICARQAVRAERLARTVNLLDFLDRDVNVGLSGGEIKKS